MHVVFFGRVGPRGSGRRAGVRMVSTIPGAVVNGDRVGSDGGSCIMKLFVELLLENIDLCQQ